MTNHTETIITPGKSNGFGLSPLPGIDIVTIIACFSVGGLINLSYSNLTERGLLLLLPAIGCIVFFQRMGHYSRRREFWQEIGDEVAAVLIALAIVSSSTASS